MDDRLFFVLGDLFSNILIGIFVGAITWLIVGPAWNMWIAMFLMMAVGMLIATVLWLPLSILLGAMEVMVPAMLTGMLSAMVVGMICAMHQTVIGPMLFVGGVCGLISIVIIWIMNNSLRGNRRIN